MNNRFVALLLAGLAAALVIGLAALFVAGVPAWPGPDEPDVPVVAGPEIVAPPPSPVPPTPRPLPPVLPPVAPPAESVPPIVVAALTPDLPAAPPLWRGPVPLATLPLPATPVPRPALRPPTAVALLAGRGRDIVLPSAPEPVPADLSPAFAAVVSAPFSQRLAALTWRPPADPLAPLPVPPARSSGIGSPAAGLTGRVTAATPAPVTLGKAAVLPRRGEAPALIPPPEVGGTPVLMPAGELRSP